MGLGIRFRGASLCLHLILLLTHDYRLQVSQLPDWAKPVAMNQVLLTRQFYANQPELLAGNTLSSANSTDSTSSSSSAGSSATGAVAAEAAASTPAATTGAGNLSSQVSGWILGITFVLSAGIVL